MRFVWSFWTKPSPSRLDWACLAQSVACVKKFATPYKIYTDSYGAESIDRLKIGCKTDCLLDELSEVDPKYWVASKLLTYSRLDYPCTHIDADVFLWKPPKFSTLSFCCQSLEDYPNHKKLYKKHHEDFLKDSSGVTPELVFPQVRLGDFSGYNMGYIQVNDWKFLNTYAAEAMKILKVMNRFNNFNSAFCEQFLFYCMVQNNNVPVETLFDNAFDWENQAKAQGYTHLMGKKRLRPKELFELLTRRLNIDNPEFMRAFRF